MPQILSVISGPEDPVLAHEGENTSMGEAHMCFEL